FSHSGGDNAQVGLCGLLRPECLLSHLFSLKLGKYCHFILQVCSDPLAFPGEMHAKFLCRISPFEKTVNDFRRTCDVQPQ
ncbi:MAG: hypothetical protein MUO63_18785, partial [Desulfobulbaceae bacterium]|nr:hypothetical protein [Desulfobulbaceae bacterium]